MGGGIEFPWIANWEECWPGNPEKVGIFNTLRKLKCLTYSRGFLLLLQFLLRLIPEFANITYGSTGVIEKRLGVHRFNAECDKSFEILKEKMIYVSVLIAPDWDKQLIEHVYTSWKAVGGSLTSSHQKERARETKYFSKKLVTPDSIYTTKNQELVSLERLLDKLRSLL